MHSTTEIGGLIQKLEGVFWFSDYRMLQLKLKITESDSNKATAKPRHRLVMNLMTILKCILQPKSVG